MARDPLNAVVVPRPIGWISTLDAAGRANLAPYSFFNAVAYRPPQVMFAATTRHAHGGLKDSIANAQETGEFVVNLATRSLREQMNASAVPAPSDVDEFAYAGLRKAPAAVVNPPQGGRESSATGVRVHANGGIGERRGRRGEYGGLRQSGGRADDRFIADGAVDTLALAPIGRLGYLDYVKVADCFAMVRPKWE